MFPPNKAADGNQKKRPRHDGYDNGNDNRTSAVLTQEDESNGCVSLEQTPVRISRSRGGFRTRALGSGYARTNDNIHKSISLCPVIGVLLDTPQMQRLRGLKQLGAAEHAYVNAIHNRFEHSLGVAHLAEKLCRQLQTRQPKLGITEKDITCVKIAGLCHDLGHGPFSHVYDGEFRYQLKKIGRLTEKDLMWKHEDASLMMFDAALAEIGLQIDADHLDEPLKQIADGIDRSTFGLQTHDILTSRDMIFVKECIMGRPLQQNPPLMFIGRDWKKEFLYDIVSNRHSGFDVDKMDYYARDKLRALGTGDIDVIFLEEAFVAWGQCSRPKQCFQCNNAHFSVVEDEDDDDTPSSGTEGKHLMICFPEKLVIKALEFFKTRFRLHTEVYTHKTAKAVEYMICDILLLADPFFRIHTSNDKYDGGIESSDGRNLTAFHTKCSPSSSSVQTTSKSYRISEAMHDPDAYLQLRDSIIDVLAVNPSPELRPAKHLIERLRRRDNYKCVCDLRMEEGDDEMFSKEEEQIRKELIAMDPKHKSSTTGEILTLLEEDIIVEKRTLHHGMKDSNPVSLMRFLPKREHHKLHADVCNLPIAERVDEKRYESHIPRVFSEKTIRVYSRTSDEKVKLIHHCFEQWKELTKARSGEDVSLSEPLEKYTAVLSQEIGTPCKPSSASKVSSGTDRDQLLNLDESKNSHDVSGDKRSSHVKRYLF